MDRKLCYGCKEFKAVDQFNKNRSKPDGLSTECRPCVRKASKRYYDDNPEKWSSYDIKKRERLGEEGFKAKGREKAARHRASPTNTAMARYRKARYGLTPEAFEAMMVGQGGLCAICRQPPSGRWPTLHIDHCHRTGRVRGLLCFPCNVGLGSLGDSVDRVMKAAEYLRRHLVHDEGGKNGGEELAVARFHASGVPGPGDDNLTPAVSP